MKSNTFAYTKFRQLPEWVIIDKAIDDLVRNGDLIENTNRDHIVGFLVKMLHGEEKSSPARSRSKPKRKTS